MNTRDGKTNRPWQPRLIAIFPRSMANQPLLKNDGHQIEVRGIGQQVLFDFFQLLQFQQLLENVSLDADTHALASR